MVHSLPPEFYTPFLSTLAKERKPSPIRGLYPLERPGVISLLAGKPNADTFPLTAITLTSRAPDDPTRELTTEVSGRALADGLQYGPTAGLPALCEWVYGLQEREHGRRRGEGWRVSIGAGSQDVIYKAVMTLVNPGDAVLVECPVYAGVLPMFQALHCDLIEVDTDEHGIRSSSLHAALDTWPASKPKPKVLYTVPYGCNPTGMTATLERRQEVLALAREHNFIILEDDPYYFLYYGDAARYPSYFKLELELPEVGRVLRFDSLSKVLSSGIRIGFASGPEPLMQAIDMHTAVANLQTSSLTQTLTVALLDAWGYDGFAAHTTAVSRFYRAKRDVFALALRRHLIGLAEWSEPEAGMFFWFKLLLSEDTDAEGDSESIIRTKAYERVFLPSGRKTALLAEDEVEQAVMRLRDVIVEAREGS
ncbi:PLP-dependent transferase [Amylocystis lapponica]|nr:PLP-dependent transferase [Amylocystis lapponica]